MTLFGQVHIVDLIKLAVKLLSIRMMDTGLLTVYLVKATAAISAVFGVGAVTVGIGISQT